MIALLASAWAHPGADEVLRASAQALATDPCRIETWLDRARALGSDGRTDEALAADPDHAGLRLERSRVLARLGYTAEAAADAERALTRVARPQPDDVLALARLYRAAGDPERALATLDRVPPSAALVEEAVAIELALGRPEGAIGRVEAMPPTAYWLARAADVRDVR